MTKKNKMCSNPPVVFSQKAINILYAWFPESNGNLCADEVWETIMNHWSDDEMTVCAPNKQGEEIVDKINAIMSSGGSNEFSPVL